MATQKRKIAREKKLRRAGQEALKIHQEYTSCKELLERAVEAQRAAKEQATQADAEIERLNAEMAGLRKTAQAAHLKASGLERDLRMATDARRAAEERVAGAVADAAQARADAKESRRYKRRYQEEKAKVHDLQRQLNKLKKGTSA